MENKHTTNIGTYFDGNNQIAVIREIGVPHKKVALPFKQKRTADLTFGMLVDDFTVSIFDFRQTIDTE